MKVVIIGMGVGGVAVAEALHKEDKDVDIVIYNQEKYYYYFRPWLIDLLAGRKTTYELFPHPVEWYERNNIKVRVNSRVVRIDPDSKTIELENGEKDRYDKLILATGSTPFVPPFKNVEGEGVSTLRSLEDTLRIIELVKKSKKGLVIGGGLLGLEMAYALKQRGLEVIVFEYFDRLLPRQLDDDGAKILQKKIEAKGIKVVTSARVSEIIRENGKVKGIAMEDGTKYEGDVVFIATGIRPNIELAKSAGLKVNKGVIVNDFLQTSNPDIYAIGDVTEHNGRVYGIIPATLDQARIVAKNILHGNTTKYYGTIPSNTLHVVGIQVTSMGEALAEGNEYEIIKKINEEKGIYKKLALKKGKIVGIIMVGTDRNLRILGRLMRRGTNVAPYKDEILDDDFNIFSILK